MKINQLKQILQQILQQIMEKNLLGTSDTWWMCHLSHRPSEPAYYIEECGIYNLPLPPSWNRFKFLPKILGTIGINPPCPHIVPAVLGSIKNLLNQGAPSISVFDWLAWAFKICKFISWLSSIWSDSVISRGIISMQSFLVWLLAVPKRHLI